MNWDPSDFFIDETLFVMCICYHSTTVAVVYFTEFYVYAMVIGYGVTESEYHRPIPVPAPIPIPIPMQGISNTFFILELGYSDGNHVAIVVMVSHSLIN